MVQPWAVHVRDGKVEDRENEGAQDGIGQDQRFERAGSDFMREVKAVDVADVGAKVDEAGGGDGHGEVELDG